MRAAVFEATKKPLVVKDVPDPQCQPNGAIVQVEANGVCRSDWHAWSGDWTWMGLAAQPGAILGHEFCGVVQEVGRKFATSKRVTASWFRSARAMGPANTAAMGHPTCA